MCKVRGALLNARSVCNKAEQIHELILDNDLHLLALTETWLKKSDGSIAVDMCPPNYRLLHKCRPSSKGERGGGVGFVLAKSIEAEEIPVEEYTTFETLAIKVKCKRPMVVMLVYRPPPSPRNNLTLPAFIDEFTEYLAEATTKHKEIMVIGDFNLHWDQEGNPGVRMFKEIIETHGIKQHVTESTHVENHILDLIMTNSDATHRVSSIKVEEPRLSDHAMITFIMTLSATPAKKTQRAIRKVQRMNRQEFTATLSRNIATINTDCPTAETLDTLVSNFSEAVTKSLDVHAPLKEITLKDGDPKPWYDNDIHQERRKRRRAERQYKKTRLTVHKQELERQSQLVIEMIKEKKSKYYQEKFKQANSKETFRLMKHLLTPPSSQNIGMDDLTAAENFKSFFEEKIRKIHTILNAADTEPRRNDGSTAVSSFTAFSPISTEELSKMIKRAPCKSCPLDPLPTNLLKENGILQLLAPIITSIINHSLSLSYVPEDFKSALVRPTLKKEDAITTELSNYRPVSNLQFLSKILERVVASQITKYLEDNGIMDPLQSAYRQAHSTETAMMKVKDDIDGILDDGDAALLVLLDLSAAFDTIDHDLLLERLATSVGVQGQALEWVRSYLHNRHQRVSVGSAHSSTSPLQTGVPQGSVLGPLLFTLYVLPLGRIIEAHDILRHHYADDTQLYTRLHIRGSPQERLQEDIQKMEKCLVAVRSWMSKNKLKLNDKKTEVLVIATKANKPRLREVTLKIGSDVITPANTVRDLGSWLDGAMDMSQQVAHTTKACFFHLRCISRIRRHLDDEACAKAINACVTSRLDYHNGLIAGARQCTLKPLNRVQNHAARLLTKTPRRAHITPVLKDLHWLPVKERADFKLLVFIQSAFHQQTAPQYIKDMFTAYAPERPLRSTDDPWTVRVTSANRHEGERQSSHHGAILWNSLPFVLRSEPSKDVFKKRLKTHLFYRAFE